MRKKKNMISINHVSLSSFYFFGDYLNYLFILSKLFKAVCISIDLTELKLDLFFDMSIWESFKCKNIKNNEISDEFKIEKDLLNDFMHKYIFDKFKHLTVTNHLVKSINGYALSRECNKPRSEKCKSHWILRINVCDKSAHLKCKFMCNHIASSINLTQPKPGKFELKFMHQIYKMKKVSDFSWNDLKLA